jgi:hypothetical protein
MTNNPKSRCTSTLDNERVTLGVAIAAAAAAAISDTKSALPFIT